MRTGRLLHLAVVAFVVVTACGLRAPEARRVMPSPSPPPSPVVSPTHSPAGTGEPLSPGPTPEPSPESSPSPVPWNPVRHCRGGSPDRPAVLNPVFLHRRDYKVWAYREALEAMERAGVPTEVIMRRGRERWSGVAAAGGVVGELVPAGARLERQAPPPGAIRASVNVFCAGLASLSPHFQIELPEEVGIRAVLHRHGDLETVHGRPYPVEEEGTRLWTLRTRARGFVIERIVEYLEDPVVLHADPGNNCIGIPEEPPPPGCDFAVSD